MNSVMEPSFKVIFAEFPTCESCEQCTGPTQKMSNALTFNFQQHPNSH